jgi:methyl-accepting chemotaxis protein
MKNAIWKKILLFMVIPFLVIFISLSVFIIQTVLRDSTEHAEQDFRNLGRLNELSLQGTIETLSLSVQVAAAELQNIDYTQIDARQQGGNILMSSFTNPLIYNAWLVFEPNAFDSRDSEFTYDYPGAPSGRYIRSYIRDTESGAIIVAPDIDETQLDNEEQGYYYLIPKQTERLFFDISSEYGDSLYDYGIGEGSVTAMGISAPVFREGVFIGVVGYDVILGHLLLGEDIVPGSTLMIFSSNGRMWFGNNMEDAGKTVRELGFENWKRYWRSLKDRNP